MAELPPDATCRQCGRHYEQKAISQVFCCKACQRAWWWPELKRRRAERRLKARTDCVCPVCAVVFTPPGINQKYCSKRCRRKAERQRYREQRRAEQQRRRLRARGGGAARKSGELATLLGRISRTRARGRQSA